MANSGDMLRLARQKKGFTQKLACEMLEVPAAHLSRIENGAAEPDEDLLAKAAVAYDVPRKFFDISAPVYGPAVSVHPMPRAKASITARDLDRVTAELNVRAMQLRKFLEAVDLDIPRNVPKLDVDRYGSPEKVASILRAHWKVPTGPIRNLTRLLEAAGCMIASSNFGGASVSGMTFQVPGLPPLVLINSDHPADRMRFTLAHELGHIVMHRFPSDSMEKEANRFASAFLIPAQDLKSSIAGRRVTLELLASLKPEWKLSMQAILFAARTHGIVTENQFRYLMSQISARNWRIHEPPELDFPREEPSVLRSIIRAHVDELGFSLDDLLAMVPMHQHEFEQYYGKVGLPVDGSRPKLRIVQ